MYTPPLARKLLPWIYTLVFLIVAPLLILYTAGYRYNVKKAAVEKRGTLIMDSIPDSAVITIDDQPTGSKTPAAFQELTPGWHHIRVSKEGYTTWEKTLEIRPERVTFADHIHLWQTAPETQLTLRGNIERLAMNPDQDTLAAFAENASTSSATLFLLQGKGRLSLEGSVPAVNDPLLSWQASSRALLLDGPNMQDTVVRFVKNTLVATTTPAQAFWNGDELLAANGTRTWHWSSRTGSVTTTLLPSSTYALVANARLEQTASSSLVRLALERTFSTQRFSLPEGAWTFADARGDTLLLRHEQDWLALDRTQAQPFLGRISGDYPRWLPTETDKAARALFIHGNELWLWNMGEPPILLIRQSEPIQAAAWDPNGDAVFFAGKTQLHVLDLDERGGRDRQTLATFTEVKAIERLGKILYVAGTKEGETGLWALTIE